MDKYLLYLVENMEFLLVNQCSFFMLMEEILYWYQLTLMLV